MLYLEDYLESEFTSQTVFDFITLIYHEMKLNAYELDFIPEKILEFIELANYWQADWLKQDFLIFFGPNQGFSSINLENFLEFLKP